MNIGMIGAGNVGTALTKACVRAGHSVTVSARHLEEAEGLANITGARAVDSNAEAVENADIVILAIPYSSLNEVAAELHDELAGRIVIELSDPVAPDLDHRLAATSAAEELQDTIDEVKVVKAFNTVFAALQADPVIDGVHLDGLYCGDDEYAKKQVAMLLEDLGYEPVDCGPLIAARILEDMGLLLIRLNAVNNWGWRNAWKLVGPRV